VALIRWGTKSSQQTVVGTLGDIVGKATAEAMEPPTIIVVGEVVRLRNQLNWFETRPLFGMRILVTRPKEQAGELSQLLRTYGADPVECPTIRIVPPATWDELDEAIASLDRYHWLVFTSVNGVGPFMERLREKGRDVRALSGLRLACIGPRTAEELAEWGLKADVIPTDYHAEGLLDALKAAGVAGQRILISRAAVAREVLPEQLRALGAEVRVVIAYRTVRPEVDVSRLKELLQRHELHVITFTSSSTVHNFCALFDSRDEMKKLTAQSAIACIGPITAKTATEYGLPTAIVAPEHTIPALVEAIVRHGWKPVGAASGR
jgi:uroporphyrinogen III methyltransferase/synthase